MNRSHALQILHLPFSLLQKSRQKFKNQNYGGTVGLE